MQPSDLAPVIVNDVQQFEFPERPLDTINPKEILPPGFPVGWCGYRTEKRILDACDCEVILSGPGRGGSPLVRSLRRDLAGARSAQWRRQRSPWMRLKQRFAHFVMARLDPWIARTQWRSLPD